MSYDYEKKQIQAKTKISLEKWEKVLKPFKPFFFLRKFYL